MIRALSLLTLLYVGWIAFALRVEAEQRVEIIPAAVTCPNIPPMSPRGSIICGSKKCVQTERLT